MESLEPGCLFTQFLLRYKRFKNNKSRQNTLFLCGKKLSLLPDNQLSINVPFQSTKQREKELCVHNKSQEAIGDWYCPTYRNEECVYFSTHKTSSFYDSKKCTTCCQVLNFLFKDQKLTFMMFGGDGTNCFARKTSRDYEKEKPSPISRNYLGQSESNTPEPKPKKAKIFTFMA